MRGIVPDMGSERVPVGDAFDEDRDQDGSPRPGYAETLAALEGADLDALRRARGAQARAPRGELRPRSVRRGSRAAAHRRAASGTPWRRGSPSAPARSTPCYATPTASGGSCGAGVISDETIEGAEGYEPELLGRLPAQRSLAPVIGFDVVRDPDGAFLVLEDNLRTPSGFAYAVAAAGRWPTNCRRGCRRAAPSTRSRGSCSAARCAPRRRRGAATTRRSSC